MSKMNKLPRTAVLDRQIAALEQSEQPLDEHALEQVKGGALVLPMYGVPFFPAKRSHPIRRI